MHLCARSALLQLIAVNSTTLFAVQQAHRMTSIATHLCSRTRDIVSCAHRHRLLQQSFGMSGMFVGCVICHYI
jgi:hypothetical protein